MLLAGVFALDFLCFLELGSLLVYDLCPFVADSQKPPTLPRVSLSIACLTLLCLVTPSFSVKASPSVYPPHRVQCCPLLYITMDQTRLDLITSLPTLPQVLYIFGAW